MFTRLASCNSNAAPCPRPIYRPPPGLTEKIGLARTIRYQVLPDPSQGSPTSGAIAAHRQARRVELRPPAQGYRLRRLSVSGSGSLGSTGRTIATTRLAPCAGIVGLETAPAVLLPVLDVLRQGLRVEHVRLPRALGELGGSAR